MIKKHVASVIFIVLSMLAFSSAQAAGDATKGKALYLVCSTCHGANGEGNVALHSAQIAGMPAYYLITQLKNFKSGVRGTAAGDIYGAQMRPMSLTLANDQAIEDVVAYIGTFKPIKPPTTIKGDVAKGKTLYATCVACHGANGEGVAALNSPNLTNLQDWYIVDQLKSFKAGYRGADPTKDLYGAQMRPMALILADDQAINDVTAYISSLK